MRYFRQFRAERAARNIRPSAHGFSLAAPPLYLSDEFDSAEIAAFKACLDRIDICAAKAGKPVIAIEPLHDNLIAHYKNLEVNEIEDVEVFPMGAASRAGTFKVYNQGSMGSFVKGWGRAPEQFATVVSANTLDRIVGDRLNGKTALVKIDVEGFELDVLKGASATLLADPRPVWLFENFLASKSHPDGLNPNFLSVLDVFWSADYIVTAAESGQVVDRQIAERWMKERKSLGGSNFMASSG